MVGAVGDRPAVLVIHIHFTQLVSFCRKKLNPAASRNYLHICTSFYLFSQQTLTSSTSITCLSRAEFLTGGNWLVVGRRARARYLVVAGIRFLTVLVGPLAQLWQQAYATSRHQHFGGD